MNQQSFDFMGEPEMQPIDAFEGDYRWLSNFWPVQIHYGERVYDSVEHAYQCQKCFGVDALEYVYASETPAEAKRRVRAVRTIVDWPDWSEMRVSVMRELIALKFHAGGDLAGRLCATHPRPLIEGNTWGDRFWGVCEGKGQNMLGKLLMERRYYLMCMENR